MEKDDFFFGGIGSLAEAYRSGRLTPLEVTRHTLARIERLNPRLNAYLSVAPEQAMLQARQAQEEMSRGIFRSRLHGVPVAVKDLFFQQGQPARAASKMYVDFRPDFDATVVSRLKNSGAILVGRTHMHELAFGVTNINPHFGCCHNPWNPDHIPGGSSGGSAVAVAAGLCWAALGTDSGGSIRIPASFCGVTGFKPTYGRISRHGLIPLSFQLDHVGVLARSAEDAALAAEIIAGPDPGDSGSLNQPAPCWTTELAGTAGRGRLGLVSGEFVSRIHPEVQSGIADAISIFEAAGYRIEPIEIPDAIQAGELAHLVILADGAALLSTAWRTRSEVFGQDVRSLVEQGHCIRAVDYINALRYRAIFQRELDRLFDSFSALLLPATPMAAPRITDTNTEIDGMTEEIGPAATRLVRQFNFAGTPVLTVPCGFTAARLPFGLQIVTRAGDETTGLQLGHLYQQHTTWHRQRPPFASL